ncbi:hypothetical protein SETIT_3G003400v2 [Setaria italica]|uniref:Uncharacterized protein n=1 Tax=Setaria italica TaxID=4555 RepID=A0A368QA66_SETIT|nr:hypothetical protein SETIT_3G003400v2 [Setaria italica]
MNKPPAYGHGDSPYCCFHPREVVVGVCAHCLKDRLLLLLNKDPTTQQQQGQLRRRRTSSSSISLPKVFALGSSFLQRLDSRHHRPDHDDAAHSDGTTSAASLDVRGQRQGDVGQPHQGRGSSPGAGEVFVFLDVRPGGGARQARRRHPVAQAGGGAAAAAGPLEEVRSRPGRKEGGGGSLQGQGQRLDPEPHAEARRPPVVVSQLPAASASMICNASSLASMICNAISYSLYVSEDVILYSQHACIYVLNEKGGNRIRAALRVILSRSLLLACSCGFYI